MRYFPDGLTQVGGIWREEKWRQNKTQYKEDTKENYKNTNYGTFLNKPVQFICLINSKMEMAADLKCSAREASDSFIFRFHHCGHIHVTAARRINDVNNLWLPLSCDLRRQRGNQ